MEENEIDLNKEIVAGKVVNLDDENVENLKQMANSLKEVEKNIKEKIITKMK